MDSIMVSHLSFVVWMCCRWLSGNLFYPLYC